MIKSSKFSDRIFDAIIIIVLVTVALTTLLPLAQTVAISLSDKAAVSGGYVKLWPVKFTTAPYKFILEDEKFFRAFGVSVQRVFLGGGINLILTILMAFALSREPKHFPARNFFMVLVMFAMLFHAGLIPWFITIRYLGIMDTIWALVLPGAVPIFNVIILMNFFRNIPRELEEAAIMDGAGPWTLLYNIYLPISLPALATITLFSIVGHWNSWFDGLILMNNPDNYPLQTYIQQLVVGQRYELPMESRAFIGQISDMTLNAAKLVVAMIPILVIYPFLQKYFIHGITLGSIKE